MKKIVIIGGSGFVGSMLTEALIAKGYTITIIDLVEPKLKSNNIIFVKLNLSLENLPASVIDGCYGIINLAGATIGKKWNIQYEQLLYDSRIKTTHAIIEAIKLAKAKPKVLINASGIGYYGDRGNDLLTENEKPGNDFLAHLCVAWEHEATKAKNDEVRVVLIRTGNVLGQGGLLTTLTPLFKKGLGGYFGTGKQYMPWIHWKDIVGIYIFALEQNIDGAYNACAGKALTQKELFKSFAKVLGSHFVWHIPHFAAKLVLGNFADALICSQNADAQKIIDAGYMFDVTDIGGALKSVNKKSRMDAIIISEPYFNVSTTQNGLYMPENITHYRFYQ